MTVKIISLTMAADLEKQEFHEIFSYLLSNNYPSDLDKAQNELYEGLLVCLN